MFRIVDRRRELRSVAGAWISLARVERVADAQIVAVMGRGAFGCLANAAMLRRVRRGVALPVFVSMARAA